MQPTLVDPQLYDIPEHPKRPFCAPLDVIQILSSTQNIIKGGKVIGGAQ